MPAGARREVMLGAAVALVAFWLGSAVAVAQAPRPSFVVINVDDLDERAVSLMPQIQAALVAEGLSFGQSFVSTPTCCPSRTSFLRGQYAHNHGVMANLGNFGGFERFQELGLADSTIATWLQEAGYRTGLAGKYLNQYSLRTADLEVPPGWEHWFAKVAGRTYYDYTMNADGEPVRFGEEPEDYRTDVEAGRMLDWIRIAAEDDRPFFLYWAPVAPHTAGGRGAGPRPPRAAPRHRGLFDGVSAPNVCAFNEADMGDKPGFLRGRASLDAEDRGEIDRFYRARLESMLAVDEAIGSIVRELERVGRLDSTYVIFTSDNGFHQGEHRIALGKETPYEESLRVPLVVRGPGVPAGGATAALALNLDLAPTIADLAGVEVPGFVDGRSLARILRRPRRIPTDWRNGFVAELWEAERGAPLFRAVRVTDAKFTRRSSGEAERYDLAADPYEMDSLGAAGGQAALFSLLEAALPALADCAGAECRRLEAALPAPRAPSIRILSQNGNERLEPGTRVDLRWSARDVRRVKIELLRNGRRFLTIADDVRGRSLSWRVPGDLPRDGRYKIRVKDVVPTRPRIKDAGDAAAFARGQEQTRGPS